MQGQYTFDRACLHTRKLKPQPNGIRIRCLGRFHDCQHQERNEGCARQLLRPHVSLVSSQASRNFVIGGRGAGRTLRYQFSFALECMIDRFFPSMDACFAPSNVWFVLFRGSREHRSNARIRVCGTAGRNSNLSMSWKRRARRSTRCKTINFAIHLDFTRT